MARRGLLVVSIALVAGAALAYQLLLLRLLAVVQWQILAGTVVSLALLGHGVSGIVLTLARRWTLPRTWATYVASCAAFGIAVPLAFAAAQRVRFNALELLWDPAQWGRLALMYGLLAIPFFFAASSLALAFMRRPHRIALLYGADLAGAAVGAGGVTLLLWRFPPEDLLRGITLLAGLAALAVLPELGRRARVPSFAAILAATLAPALVVPNAWLAPRPSEYKGEARLLAVMGARVLERESSPYGALTVIESAQVPLRHAPGASMLADAEPPAQLAVFTDGDAMSPITRHDADAAYAGQMTSAVPYALRPAPEVLLLGSAAGDGVLQALALGARRVTAVEPDPQRLRLVMDRFAAAGGAIYRDPRVVPLAADLRAVLRRDDAAFDLVVIPPGDSFAGASSGVLAAGEAFLYTVEAFVDALDRLRPGGLLAITRWERAPPRDGVKLVATAVEALERHGATDPASRLAVIRSWQTTTLIVKKGALTADEIAALRAFCARWAFDPAWFPGMAPDEAARHHVAARPWLHEAAVEILSPRRNAFLRDYKFAVAPATDDRPFFFHFLRWNAVPELLRLREAGGAALIDAGSLVIAATLAQAIAYSVLLIGLPLLALRVRATANRARTLVYFATLGLGFLLVEIAWLQRLVLLLGHALLAASAGLAAFLLFAGAGSACARRWRARWSSRAIPLAVALVVAGVLVLETLWPALLELAADAPLAARLALAIAMLAPLAFAMGLPFPLGLLRLADRAPALVPWAWGINGCTSVIAAAAAGLLALHAGFQLVLLGAAALYALAALSRP
ncbi:MAG TPA: hypothetical protein VJM11_07615 [Nevskiaceae bacterium]|nr:hypothetical protein [Nevskiaceae bacterium]